jgi:TnpA family transposase
LTLLTAAISLWNTVYMERAVDALKRKRATAVAFVPARLGTHQSDWRLYLEKQPDSGFR